MGLTAERLLRWMVLTREPLSEYPLERLKEMGHAARSRFTLGMRLSDGHWLPLAA